MPDFDPKNIPTLDDIIEQDNTDEAEDSADKDNFDLFSADADQAEAVAAEADINIEDKVVDVSPFTNTAYKEINIYFPDLETTKEAEDNNRTDSFDAANPEPENIESALIDYHDNENATASSHTAENSSPQNTAIENPSIEPLPKIPLQPLVEDIVTQLMPELEHQLRSLVQQTLQDRLPAEIIEQADTDIDNDTMNSTNMD